MNCGEKRLKPEERFWRRSRSLSTQSEAEGASPEGELLVLLLLCHPEGCSTARSRPRRGRIWLVLKTSTPRSLGHETGLGMTLFFLSSRASEATEGSALDSERPQTEVSPLRGCSAIALLRTTTKPRPVPLLCHSEERSDEESDIGL